MEGTDERPPRGPARLLIAAGVLAIVGALALLLVLVLPDRTEQPATTSAPVVTPDVGTAPATREQGARFVAAGECVSIGGTEQDPLLNIISCGPGGYQVLQRFDGTIDADATCKDVRGYEYNFSYDSALDSLDFVLCLNQLK